MYASSRLLRTPNAARRKGFITGESLLHCYLARRLIMEMHADLLWLTVTLYWFNLFLNCTSNVIDFFVLSHVLFYDLC